MFSGVVVSGHVDGVTGFIEGVPLFLGAAFGLFEEDFYGAHFLLSGFPGVDGVGAVEDDGFVDFFLFEFDSGFHEVVHDAIHAVLEGFTFERVVFVFFIHR